MANLDPVDYLMNDDVLTEPWMPAVKDRPLFGSMGIVSFSYTTVPGRIGRFAKIAQSIARCRQPAQSDRRQSSAGSITSMRGSNIRYTQDAATDRPFIAAIANPAPGAWP